MVGAKATGAFTESADEMVMRVCRELGGKSEILVINDSAHHCYRPNPTKTSAKPKMTAEVS